MVSYFSSIHGWNIMSVITSGLDTVCGFNGRLLSCC